MNTIAYTSTSDGLTVDHAHSRQTFAVQRRAALAKQRDSVQARLDSLRKEVRKIQARAGLMTDEAEIRDAIAKLERMNRAEHKLVDDIARLTAKIGA